MPVTKPFNEGNHPGDPDNVNKNTGLNNISTNSGTKPVSDQESNHRSDLLNDPANSRISFWRKCINYFYP